MRMHARWLCARVGCFLRCAHVVTGRKIQHRILGLTVSLKRVCCACIPTVLGWLLPAIRLAQDPRRSHAIQTHRFHDYDHLHHHSDYSFLPEAPMSDPVAEKSGFLRMYMSSHPDTLVAYAKWYGKVTEPIASAEMTAIDCRVRPPGAHELI